MKAPRWFITLFGGLLFNGTIADLQAETLDFEGGHFHLFRVDPDEIASLKLIWINEQDDPLQEFRGTPNSPKCPKPTDCFRHERWHLRAGSQALWIDYLRVDSPSAAHSKGW